MKYYVLYNPLAGHGSHQEKLDMICALYKEETVTLNITETGLYNRLTQMLEADDVIILCGGDGTVNRFVNDTEHLDIKNAIIWVITVLLPGRSVQFYFRSAHIWKSL